MIKKEDKYFAFVIPRKELDEFIEANPETWTNIMLAVRKYSDFRKERGRKPNNQYVLVNQDEPYIEDVWKAVLEGETMKEGKIMRNKMIEPNYDAIFQHDTNVELINVRCMSCGHEESHEASHDLSDKDIHKLYYVDWKIKGVNSDITLCPPCNKRMEVKDGKK